MTQFGQHRMLCQKGMATMSHTISAFNLKIREIIMQLIFYIKNREIKTQ